MCAKLLETGLVPIVPGFSLRAIYSGNSLLNTGKPGTVGTLGMSRQFSNLRMERRGNKTGNCWITMTADDKTKRVVKPVMKHFFYMA
jgi:hypothetical protein